MKKKFQLKLAIALFSIFSLLGGVSNLMATPPEEPSCYEFCNNVFPGDHELAFACTMGCIFGPKP